MVVGGLAAFLKRMAAPSERGIRPVTKCSRSGAPEVACQQGTVVTRSQPTGPPSGEAPADGPRRQEGPSAGELPDFHLVRMVLKPLAAGLRAEEVPALLVFGRRPRIGRVDATAAHRVLMPSL